MYRIVETGGQGKKREQKQGEKDNERGRNGHGENGSAIGRH